MALFEVSKFGVVRYSLIVMCISCGTTQLMSFHLEKRCAGDTEYNKSTKVQNARR